MAYLNEVQGYEEAVQKLKIRIQDVLPKFKHDFFRHDQHLLKYLLARDWDVEKAEEMIRKHIEWRQENQVDKLLDKRFPKPIEEGSVISFTGRDKLGHPVVWHPVGRWEVRKTVKLGWCDDMRQIIRQYCEALLDYCRHLTATEGKFVGQYVPIMDMEGFDYSQLMSIDAVQMFRDTVQEYFDQYPEMPCRILVINAPRLFKILWAIVEPLMSRRSLNKIEIYGPSKDIWKARLLELIDPDNLPSALGGSNTVWIAYRAEIGTNVVVKSETLPESDFEQTLIPAGQKHVAEYALQAGDTIVWNFQTEDYDIGFEACLEDGEIIAKYARVDSHKFVQKGLLRCKNSGKCTLTFDNSFSKLTGKTLRLAVRTKH